jgi:DNA sulfur modification protein DndE
MAMEISLVLPNRVHISKRASDQLKLLKSKTGVTPNILCRMALALSLEEKYNANPDTTDIAGSEFNLPTLLGEYGPIYEAILKQAYGRDLNPKEAELILAAHIDNGVEKLKRAKNVSDLINFGFS